MNSSATTGCLVQSGSMEESCGTYMRRLAESGSSAKEIAAISGHRTLKEIERYTAAADQVRLSKAAIAKLRGDKTRT